jgi:hypothetical protein
MRGSQARWQGGAVRTGAAASPAAGLRAWWDNTFGQTGTGNSLSALASPAQAAGTQEIPGHGCPRTLILHAAAS